MGRKLIRGPPFLWPFAKTAMKLQPIARLSARGQRQKSLIASDNRMNAPAIVQCHQGQSEAEGDDPFLNGLRGAAKRQASTMIDQKKKLGPGFASCLDRDRIAKPPRGNGGHPGGRFVPGPHANRFGSGSQSARTPVAETIARTRVIRQPLAPQKVENLRPGDMADSVDAMPLFPFEGFRRRGDLNRGLE